MKQFFLTILQKALNGYLGLDSEYLHRCKRLEGKIVRIQLQGLEYSFDLIFMENGIRLAIGEETLANTTLIGTPLSLLHVSLEKNNRQRFFAEDVIIQGNVELGQQVIELFDQLEIDWEEYLSGWLGDVPSHQLGRFTRAVKKWGQQTRNILLQNLNEYIHEEIILFPPLEAVQDFFLDVDHLRMDVDRLEARIDRIQNVLQRNLS